MAYCGPRGIPYEEWLGIVDGWSEFSRGCALAWQDREARRCPQCGQVDDDWREPDGMPMRVPPFQVVGHTCQGCESVHMHREDLDDHAPPYVHPRFVPVAASPPSDPDRGTVRQ